MSAPFLLDACASQGKSCSPLPSWVQPYRKKTCVVVVLVICWCLHLKCEYRMVILGTNLSQPQTVPEILNSRPHPSRGSSWPCYKVFEAQQCRAGLKNFFCTKSQKFWKRCQNGQNAMCRIFSHQNLASKSHPPGFGLFACLWERAGPARQLVAPT